MKRSTAALCLDCDEIYEGKNCPSCGSSSQFHISRVIKKLEVATEYAEPVQKRMRFCIMCGRAEFGMRIDQVCDLQSNSVLRRNCIYNPE